MKQIFIETKYEGEIKLPSSLVKELPKKVMLAMPVQYIDFVEQLKEQLKGKEVSLFKSVHGQHKGQILGCDVFKVKKEVEAFLYVGDGMFHPRALLFGNKKPVFIYNPRSEEWLKLGKKERKEIETKKRVALSRFQMETKIGVIISTKSGQRVNEKLIKNLEEKYPDKQFYRFVCNEIDLDRLQNFNFIESWVNTACPRLVEDFSLVNIRELLDQVKGS